MPPKKSRSQSGAPKGRKPASPRKGAGGKGASKPGSAKKAGPKKPGPKKAGAKPGGPKKSTSKPGAAASGGAKKGGPKKGGPKKGAPKKGGPKRGAPKKGAPKLGGPKSGGAKSGGLKRVRPIKRRPAPQPTSELPGERLQKVLAGAGLASRRECEELILEGRVQVDGEVVTELGTRVEPTKQTIHVDGEPLPKPKLAYYAVNKPTGVVSTASDPSGRQRVIDLLPPSLGRLYNVGRLDMASEGLILVTNDGELANRLTHPRHGVEKTYNVQVAGVPGREVLDQLREGVYFAEGKVQVVRVKIKSTRKQSTILEIVLDEGRNREIRRMLAKVGHKVQRLVRVAVGPVRLAEMPAGAYRRLTAAEVRELRKAANMED